MTSRTDLAKKLAHIAGSEAQAEQEARCVLDACACAKCGPRAYDDSSRQEFSCAMALPIDELERRLAKARVGS
jgi:hypothetical protein